MNINRSYEVEYCNLELRFDRPRIQNFISDLIEEGYSLYWNETESQFVIAIRSGRKLVKLKFERMASRFKLVGTYSFRDPKLSELMEELINETRGHAVVKRFKDRQILIDNIMFGEIIKTVEISGIGQKVLYDKGPSVSQEAVKKAFESNRIEQRIPVLKLELDYELATLHDALAAGDDNAVQASLHKLSLLREEWVQYEC